MRKIHFILFIHLIGRSLYSQVQPELDWYKIYNGPGNSYDFFHDIQIIGSEIYVAGGSYMPDGFADAFLLNIQMKVIHYYLFIILSGQM